MKHRLLIPLFLFALALTLFSTAPPVVAQVNGTDVTYQIDTDDTGVLPFGELKTVIGFGDWALLEFQRGHFSLVERQVGEDFAATYGNPDAIISVSWVSGGSEIKLDVRQQAGENETKFAARAAKVVTEMKKVFPPDPPPTACLLLPAMEPRCPFEVPTTLPPSHLQEHRRAA